MNRRVSGLVFKCMRVCEQEQSQQRITFPYLNIWFPDIHMNLMLPCPSKHSIFGILPVMFLFIMMELLLTHSYVLLLMLSDRRQCPKETRWGMLSALCKCPYQRKGGSNGEQSIGAKDKRVYKRPMKTMRRLNLRSCVNLGRISSMINVE